MPLVQMDLNVILCQRKVISVETANYDESNTEQKTKEVKKCLFGSSNPEETKKMLEEQLESDRKRLIDRYGIDILKLEEAKENGKIKTSKKRRLTDNVLKPYNKQARLTDIYQIRKRFQATVKDEEEV